ncbi:MAG TPA: COX15/CtaA family protein [Nevskia sp.]|nr:COX15/CtaA family protein [Nevskia sp.]
MFLFRSVNLLALVLCFVVVVFGAFVRLSDAGLGCPDWPGCYGQIAVPQAAHEVAKAEASFPARPVEAHKAWKEMIHRYLVGILSSLILGLVALAWLDGSGRAPRRLVFLLPAIVLVQIVFGALTVTMKLNPFVVTTHLLLGLTTLATIWLIWLRSGVPAAVETPARREREARSERQAWFAAQRQGPAVAPPPLPLGLRLAAGLGLLLVVGQIFLGGWTSSNYAATACPDFPACLGSFTPQTSLGQAFDVWHGAGANYEYGILDGAARATIHLLHRYGALAVSLVLGSLALFLLARARTALWRRLAWSLLGALLLQVAIGISVVKLQFPLLLADAHNAGAAVLLLAVVAVNFFAWRQPQPSQD